MHKLTLGTGVEKPVTNLSLYLGNGGYSFIDSEFLLRLRSLRREGVYAVDVDRRIDLVSDAIYGSTRYWWILLFYNEIADPWSLREAQVINFPAQRDIEALYFELRTKSKLQARLG